MQHDITVAPVDLRQFATAILRGVGLNTEDAENYRLGTCRGQFRGH